MVICTTSLHKCLLTGFGFIDNINFCITSPNKSHQRCSATHATLSMTLGWTTTSDRRGTCPRKMFLVPHQSSMAQWQMEICQPRQPVSITSPWQHWATYNNTVATINQSLMNTGHMPSTRWQWQRLIQLSPGSGMTMANVHGLGQGNPHSCWLWPLSGNSAETQLSTCHNKSFKTTVQCHHVTNLNKQFASDRFCMLIPQAIVHGPWQWGRLNIPNLFTKQGSHMHTTLLWQKSQWHDGKPHPIVVGRLYSGGQTNGQYLQLPRMCTSMDMSQWHGDINLAMVLPGTNTDYRQTARNTTPVSPGQRNHVHLHHHQIP